MTAPKVAVIGRQNVGKSTLVNRIFGHRAVVAHQMPGVTRDRVELETTWGGRTLALVDTAGYLPRARGVEALAADQAAVAVAEADVILLVVDVRTGITEDDAALARRLRTATVPVVLVANKADAPADVADVAALHRLGLGEPVPVSALHGQGVGDLLDRVLAFLPEAGEEVPGTEEPRFVIVGRPNVGKSSLFNRLVGRERSVVSEVAGTTRDSVDSLIEWPDLGRVRFIDTAGMRRGQSVRGIEYFSFLRTAEAIDAAHVALLVIEAPAGLTTEDKKIAKRVIDAGRALLVIANKWDLLEDKASTFEQLSRSMSTFADAAVVRTSATHGQGVHRLPPIAMDLHARWSSRAATATVNAILGAAQLEQPTPRTAGTLHYATQVATGPPTFVIFGGARPPGPSYRRYLERRLREALDLSGVPIRLRFRARGERG
ncbi:MAG TPA: ribosome biogenesis GTPase Der [Actinomycetota bacterium]|nr:ribosome biogenesis GTPase Der [Actinomycetota bacterium]